MLIKIVVFEKLVKGLNVFVDMFLDRPVRPRLVEFVVVSRDVPGMSLFLVGFLRIANNSPPPKVTHPHPIHPLSLFANSSPPPNRGSLSVRRKQGYYSQTGLPDPSDGRGLL